MQQTPAALLAANNDVVLNRPWQHLSERMIHSNPLCTEDLLRLPPRTVSGNHAISGDQPLKRQDVFGTLVTTAYSAILREIATKGAEARFVKAEPGKFMAKA